MKKTPNKNGILIIHGGGQCAGSSANVGAFVEELKNNGFKGPIGICKYSFAGLTETKNYKRYNENNSWYFTVPNYLGTSRVDINCSDEVYIQKVVSAMTSGGYNKLAIFGGDGSSNLAPLLAKALQKYGIYVLFCGSHTGDGFLCGQDQVGAGPEAAAKNHFEQAKLWVFNDWNTKVSVEKDIFCVSILHLQGRRKADPIYRLLKEMEDHKHMFYDITRMKWFVVLPGATLESLKLELVQKFYESHRVGIIMSEGAKFSPEELNKELEKMEIRSRVQHLGYLLQAGNNQYISPRTEEATKKIAQYIAKNEISRSACMVIMGGKLYIESIDYFAKRNPSRDETFTGENLTAKQRQYLEKHAL